jgi:hypothetical protein
MVHTPLFVGSQVSGQVEKNWKVTLKNSWALAALCLPPACTKHSREDGSSPFLLQSIFNVLSTSQCSSAITGADLFQYLSMKAMKKLMLHLSPYFYSTHRVQGHGKFVCKLICLVHQTYFYCSSHHLTPPSHPTTTICRQVQHTTCSACYNNSTLWYTNSIVCSSTGHSCLHILDKSSQPQ